MQPVMILAVSMKNILGLALSYKAAKYKLDEAFEEVWSDMKFDPNEFDK